MHARDGMVTVFTPVVDNSPERFVTVMVPVTKLLQESKKQPRSSRCSLSTASAASDSVSSFMATTTALLEQNQLIISLLGSSNDNIGDSPYSATSVVATVIIGLFLAIVHFQCHRAENRLKEYQKTHGGSIVMDPQKAKEVMPSCGQKFLAGIHGATEVYEYIGVKVPFMLMLSLMLADVPGIRLGLFIVMIGLGVYLCGAKAKTTYDNQKISFHCAEYISKFGFLSSPQQTRQIELSISGDPSEALLPSNSMA